MNDERKKIDTGRNKYMIFKIENEYYGIDIHYVNEIIDIQPITQMPDSEEYIKGLINLRGKIIPVVDVRIRFRKEALAYHDRVCIIVVHIKSVTVGLIVDMIAEVVSIEELNIVPPPKSSFEKEKTNQYIYGIAKYADRVILLLDVERLLDDKELD